MLPPLLSLRGLPPPPRGACSCSSLTPADEVQFSPPYPALPLHLALVLHGRHSVLFAHSRRWAFQARCQVPFHLGNVVLSENTSVSNFSTSSSFRIRKSIGRGYSTRSSQVSGSRYSSHPPSSTFMVMVPLPGYSYTHSPSSHLASWHLTAPFLRSTWVHYIKTRLGYARPPGSR